MKILWLNDSLVLRGETRQEKSALATLLVAPKTMDDDTGPEEAESSEVTNISVL